MGYVFAEITLKNLEDTMKSNIGLFEKSEIRQKTMQALVDTGAGTLVINEEIRQELGLELIGEKQVRLANGDWETVKIAGPVEVCWKNRNMVCRPWFISNAGEVLLGAIPLEEMDLMVNPNQQELVGAHGDIVLGRL